MKLFLKILFFIALIQTLFAGCVDHVITEEVFSHPDYIGFNSTTTRASVSKVTTLQNDINGFRVYAVGGSNPSGWFTDLDNRSIDGNNPYKYNAGQWVFNKPVKWSSNAYDYPMTFYALYPYSPAGLPEPEYSFSSGVQLTALFTVQGADSQIDLLAAKASTASRPASGALTLTFNHILSKVNFGIIAGTGTEPVIQSLQVVNADNTRIYDMVAADWSTTPPGSVKSAYYYYGVPDGNTITAFTPNVRDENTANAFYTSNHNKHLMLMPQTTASWTPQSGTAPNTASGGYISLIYRMSTGSGTNGTGTPREVGYPDASLHPDYASAGGGVTGPLYVKAGFPLPSTMGNFTWEKGRSYLYNIALGVHGSCNGYILDEYYYDEKGARTGLRLIEVRSEGKRVGDKLQNGKIGVTLEVDSWDSQNGGDVTPGTVTVTPTEVMLPFSGNTPSLTKTLTVNCVKGNGSPNPSAGWTLSVSDSWIRISLDPNTDFNGAVTSLAGTGTQTVYIYAEDNLSDAFRSTPYLLDGTQKGIIYQFFNYINIPGIHATPSDFIPYVGAFWRAGQTGERIIRMEVGANSVNNGSWSASVAWLDEQWGPGDGVVLSIDSLPGTQNADPNIYTANPGDAEDYQVENGSIAVSGNVTGGDKFITFRIGLKSGYVPTSHHPVRYGLIVFSYANDSKHKLIYLRQGEEADYLLCNSDPVNTGGISARTVTKRFSPFNLTAQKFDTVADIPGTIPALNPTKFTEYPSQAGAFFQWSNAYDSPSNPQYIRMRWSWNPYMTNIPPSPISGSWQPSSDAMVMWATIEDKHETCPVGYRRPHDGSITNWINPNDISNSELRQSLFMNPLTGFNYSSDLSNSMSGYYADGFFDRRPITNGKYVAAGSGDIAYIGRLFYNSLYGGDHYGASVFFPNGGMRYPTTGLLLYGDSGYWSSSSSNYNGDLHGIFLRLLDTHAGPWNTDKATGCMVRCIKDE